jgi:phosphatidylglycerophosphate synthase
MSMARPSSPGSAAPRRVLATRNAGWARALAGWLAAADVSPNAVSIASVLFAAAAAAAFVLAPAFDARWRAAGFVFAGACIQLRLLCNLLDGMLAVEHGRKHKNGDIFNDLPDRLADIVILAGAGYAAPQLAFSPALGWAAAAMAVLTAYVRVLAGSLGLTQHFIGPMAKQHRMFTLTVASLAAAVEAGLSMPARAVPLALVVIVVGSAVTAARRTVRLLNEAEAG